MYRELVLKLSQGIPYVTPQPPCPEESIAAAEQAAGVPFPQPLRKPLPFRLYSGVELFAADNAA